MKRVERRIYVTDADYQRVRAFLSNGSTAQEHPTVLPGVNERLDALYEAVEALQKDIRGLVKKAGGEW